MSMRKLLFAVCLSLAALAAEAADTQSPEAIVASVERFVREKTASDAYTIEVSVTRPDARLRLARCGQLEPWLPEGNKLWGRASVGVRCRAPAWSIYVPVLVKVSGPVLVAARPVARGQAIAPEDVQTQVRDVTQYRGGVLASPEQVVGKTAANPIKTGDILRPELLRAPLLVKQGQPVRLIAQGNGFKVSSEGVAMANASDGQIVAVKTRSGQIIKGIARKEGVVEVYF